MISNLSGSAMFYQRNIYYLPDLPAFLATGRHSEQNRALVPLRNIKNCLGLR
jgi:hypothetical protein